MTITLPPLGSRWKIKHNHSDPHDVWRITAGMVFTVKVLELHYLNEIMIMMEAEEHVLGLEEWDNCLQTSPLEQDEFFTNMSSFERIDE